MEVFCVGVDLEARAIADLSVGCDCRGRKSQTRIGHAQHSTSTVVSGVNHAIDWKDLYPVPGSYLPSTSHRKVRANCAIGGCASPDGFSATIDYAGNRNVLSSCPAQRMLHGQ